MRTLAVPGLPAELLDQVSPEAQDASLFRVEWFGMTGGVALPAEGGGRIASKGSVKHVAWIRCNAAPDTTKHFLVSNYLAAIIENRYLGSLVIAIVKHNLLALIGVF